MGTSQTRLAYVAESTYGVTPATPTWQNQRFTGEGLNPNVENETSNEIRADRNVTDLIQVGSSAGGNVDFEFSYGTFDDFLESALFGTWSSDVLVNGVTEKSFTLEKTFETGATDQYHRFTGSIVNNMSLTASVGSIVTGNFDFLCKEGTSAQAEVAGSTYTAANTNNVINSATNFASLAITGASGIQLTELSLNVANNLAQQRVLGSLGARGMTSGRFEVTGSITAYFESASIYEMFLNDTSADLTFKLGGASASNYVFDVPNLKFENVTVNAGSNDEDLLVSADFRGLYDASDAGTLKITRTA